MSVELIFLLPLSMADLHAIFFGARPPYGPQFFRFYIHPWRHWRSTTPKTGPCRPYGKSWIRPCLCYVIFTTASFPILLHSYHCLNCIKQLTYHRIENISVIRILWAGVLAIQYPLQLISYNIIWLDKHEWTVHTPCHYCLFHHNDSLDT